MRKAITVVPILLVLTACTWLPPAEDSQPLQTLTPSPPGTWEMVIEGSVYDRSTGEPIAGAVIQYLVVHSYFLEIQTGRPNTTTSDSHGEFRLPMIVHDTDNIRLRVEAVDYQTYEEKLDLFGDRVFKIGLTPLETESTSSP